jgi:hypothetical protein
MGYGGGGGLGSAVGNFSIPGSANWNPASWVMGGGGGANAITG